MIDNTEHRRLTSATWQTGFLELLPAILRQARRALRPLAPEARDDALAEVVAECLLAYRRLWERGELARAYPTSLARYAILRFQAGRRVGSPLNSRDVGSGACRQRYQLVCQSWQDILVEDRQAGPAEVAASRIDMGTWLSSLPKRTRRVAECLATGETTSAAARMFGVTPGRVSQLRAALRQSWHAFQGLETPDAL
jgi:hypothetical protein